MSLLEIKDVSLSFGGVRALDHVSLDLNRGEILGLIGPNGAGKTTLFNCISGVLAPDSGRMRFEGRSIMDMQPHQRAARGIARTFQDLQLWGSMTVLENCKLPIDALNKRNIISDALRLPDSLVAERAADERARAVLHSLDLLRYADVLAGDLSVGLQRRVEVARALCMRPKLLLLDEPASGLDAHETLELADRLAQLRDRYQVTMLLVDHDMSLVMRACHYIYVLDFGEVIAAGKPEKVRDDPKVISAYLGEGSTPEESARKAEAASVTVAEPAPTGAPVAPAKQGNLLEVKALHAGYGGIEVIRDLNLEVGWGEIVACIGGNGAGKTTTLRALSGVIRPFKGTIRFDGHEIAGRSPQSIVHLGMVHIPQGRGLFPRLTVEESLRLSHYSGHMDEKFDAAYSAFPVLKQRSSQLVGTLSGGEQQMLAMARALLVKPKLLLLDEMSQGLAPTVVQQLFQRIDLFRQQGTAVFLVEQFVDSALAVADRAYVFEQGTIAHEAPAALLRRDQTVLASSYLGTAIDVKAPVLAAAGGDGTSGRLMEDLTFKLPAEIKRALEEKADREGRRTEDLLLEVLGTSAKEAS